MSGKAFGRILSTASDIPDCLSPHDVRDVAAALERARVVGVLDAWATEGGFQWTCESRVVQLHTFLEGSDDPLEFVGATPDEARSAAAKAIESGEV